MTAKIADNDSGGIIKKNPSINFLWIPEEFSGKILGKNPGDALG